MSLNCPLCQRSLCQQEQPQQDQQGPQQWAPRSFQALSDMELVLVLALLLEALDADQDTTAGPVH